jgi:hypothetical protein
MLAIGLVAGSLLAGLALAEPPAAAPRIKGQAPHRSPGKPAAPLALRYELGAQPAVGVPLRIRVEVQADPEVTDVALEARTAPDGPLLLLAAAPQPAGPASAHAWEILVLPQRAATAYVSVVASGGVAGERQARSFMIPVRFPADEPVAAEVAADDPHGPDGPATLVLLPAVETR